MEELPIKSVFAGGKLVAGALDGATIRKLDGIEPWRSAFGIQSDLIAGGESPHCTIHHIKVEGQERHHHKRTTEFHIVLEGEGMMELDGQWWKIGKGDLIFVPCNTWHSMKAGEGTELRVLVVACPPEREGQKDVFFKSDEATEGRSDGVEGRRR